MFYLSCTVIFLKFSQAHKPWMSLHTLHFFICFSLGSGSSLASVALSFLDPLRTCIVSEAMVINSDSLSINSLNVLKSLVLELSQTQCLYLARRFLMKLCWREMYSDPLPSSASWLAPVRVTATVCSSSVNCLRSFSFPSGICLMVSNSTSHNVSTLCFPPRLGSTPDLSASCTTTVSQIF